MTKSFELIFDFGSPNAYLTLKVLPELLDRTGADLIITPCLLGGIFKATGNKAPMVQYAEAPAKLAYEHLEMRRFIERHGLTKFRLNPHFPVNTLTIMRCAIVAEEEGNLGAYVDAVNRAMWEEGLKMDDPEVIAAFLSANGFDGPRAARADAGVRDQGKTRRQHRGRGRARGVRHPHFLRRRRHVFRQGQTRSGCRGTRLTPTRRPCPRRGGGFLTCGWKRREGDISDAIPGESGGPKRGEADGILLRAGPRLSPGITWSSAHLIVTPDLIRGPA
jgi:2-hydroxychromene-2-carboxylate isomerase